MVPFDITLVCHSGRTIQTHKTVLQLASEVLHGVLECSTSDVLKVDDNAEAWNEVLIHLYPTYISPGALQLTWASVHLMLPVAHKYAMEGLMRRCLSFTASQPLSVDAASDAYVIRWVRVAEALQLPDLLDRCLAFIRDRAAEGHVWHFAPPPAARAAAGAAAGGAGGAAAGGCGSAAVAAAAQGGALTGPAAWISAAAADTAAAGRASGAPCPRSGGASSAGRLGLLAARLLERQRQHRLAWASAPPSYAPPSSLPAQHQQQQQPATTAGVPLEAPLSFAPLPSAAAGPYLPWADAVATASQQQQAWRVSAGDPMMVLQREGGRTSLLETSFEQPATAQAQAALAPAASAASVTFSPASASSAASASDLSTLGPLTLSAVVQALCSGYAACMAEQERQRQGFVGAAKWYRCNDCGATMALLQSAPHRLFVRSILNCSLCGGAYCLMRTQGPPPTVSAWASATPRRHSLIRHMEHQLAP